MATEVGELTAAVKNLVRIVESKLLKEELPSLHKKMEEMTASLSQISTIPKSGSDGSTEEAEVHPRKFCGQKDCIPCSPMIATVRQLEREEVLKIPGVAEAIQYTAAMAKMGYQEESWAKVPKVAEAISFHKLMLTPVTAEVGG